MDVAIEQKMRDIDNEGDKKARTTEDGSIPCMVRVRVRVRVRAG
jgi:hypothetical protein